MTQIRLNQIKNLVDIKKNYHPILSVLFKRYKHPILGVLCNIFVGLCCGILLISVAYGFFVLFMSYATEYTLAVRCSAFVFFLALIFTLRSLYSSMYGKQEQNILKSLPIKRSEILTAIFINYFKEILLISSLFYLVAVVVSLYKYSSLKYCFVYLVLSFLVPSIAIIFSMLLCALKRRFFSKKKLRVKKANWTKKNESTLKSLVRFEKKNIYSFPTLKMELISQFVFLVVTTLLSIYVNQIFIISYVLYPAFTAVNFSSYSREGKFHFLLETLPVVSPKRFCSKIIAYVSLVVPQILLCMFFIAIMLKSWMVVLYCIPFILCILNMTVIGLFNSKKNAKFDWTSQREAVRVDLSAILKSFAMALLTSGVVFVPETLLTIKVIVALLVSIFNIVFFIVVMKRITHDTEF